MLDPEQLTFMEWFGVVFVIVLVLFFFCCWVDLNYQFPRM